MECEFCIWRGRRGIIVKMGFGRVIYYELGVEKLETRKMTYFEEVGDAGLREVDVGVG